MAITLHIKTSTGGKFSIEVDPTISVEQFKELLQAQSNVVPAAQRLIYRGHVLKDQRTLDSYGVEDGMTVHLVKGSTPAASTTAPTTAASTTTSSAAPTTTTTTTATTTTTTAQSPQPSQQQQPTSPAAANPFAAMFGGAGAGAGGAFPQMPNMTPEQMQQMLNNPFVEGMLNDPNLLREMMLSNPQFRRVVEENPQLSHILNDPELMRQSLDLMRNPELMREQMRNIDRAMTNIEALPGGFDALRRMYTEVQEPLLDAVNPLNATPQNNQNTATTTAPSNITTNPMPNPWGGPAGTQPSQQQQQQQQQPQNPFAAFGGGMGGWGDQGAAGPMGGGAPNFEQMQQMMSNPMMQAMMQQVMSNPQFVDWMINNDPQLRSMVQANPQLRQMFSNPEFMRTLMDPQYLQQAMQMQRLLASMGMAPPRFGAPAGGMGMTNPQQTQQTQQQQQQPQQPQQQQQQQQRSPFDWTQMFGGPAGFGAPFGAPIPPQNLPPPRERFQTQLQQLQEMGFFDEQQNIQALSLRNGDVNFAIEWLLSNPPPAQRPAPSPPSQQPPPSSGGNGGDKKNN